MLMNGIALAINVPYIHLLQPNQYVDPKPMGDEERRIALSDVMITSKNIPLGYGFLKEEGRHLQEEGVYFKDLTDIFRQTNAIVYEDQCCHLNDRGNEILAIEVSKAIVDVVGSTR